jgi:hypothetical protein
MDHTDTSPADLEAEIAEADTTVRTLLAALSEARVALHRQPARDRRIVRAPRQADAAIAYGENGAF